MSVSFDATKTSTHDGTSSSFGGQLLVSVEHLVGVPVEFVRRGVVREELKVDSADKHHVEKNQRERVVASVKALASHESLSDSPPDSPTSSSSRFALKARAREHTEELIRKRDHSLERLSKIEDLDSRVESLKKQLEREKACAVERTASAQRALDHDKKSSSGWTWWR